MAIFFIYFHPINILFVCFSNTFILYFFVFEDKKDKLADVDV